MRILIATGIFPPDIGGPATFSKLLIDKLPPPFALTLLTYGELQKFDRPKITRVSRSWPRGLRHFIYFLSCLRLGRKVDLIFALDPISAGFPAVLAARLLGKKFFVRVAGDWAWEQGFQRWGVKELLDDFQKKHYGFPVEFFRYFQKLTVRLADQIVVPSFYLKRIVTGWGMPEEKIKVIYNAFTPVRYGTSPPDGEAGPPQEKIIISAGRDVPWKGFTLLKEAVEELRVEGEPVRLVIATDWPKERLWQELRAADIFVLNTGYEGLSHQILEAMSFSLPVITTNVGGNREIISDGVNGLLVPYNNKPLLKEKIKLLLANPQLAGRLGEAGKETLVKFAPERMFKELSSLLIEPGN